MIWLYYIWYYQCLFLSHIFKNVPLKNMTSGMIRTFVCWHLVHRAFYFITQNLPNTQIWAAIFGAQHTLYTVTKLLQSKVLVQVNRKEGRKEGNVWFNDALNTFYLWLYGVRHMVKDHSDCEGGNPLPPHGLLFPISSKGSFICIIPQTG